VVLQKEAQLKREVVYNLDAFITTIVDYSSFIAPRIVAMLNIDFLARAIELCIQDHLLACAIR